MASSLLIDTFALIKIWALGFFALHVSGIIHILPVIAIFAFLVWLIYNRSLTNIKSKSLIT